MTSVTDPFARRVTGPLTLALIGAGKAGRSLAALAVRAGHRVVLEDVMPAKLREALEEIPTEGMPGTLETVTTVEDAVREADLVIDFVPDELESKLEIVCMVDRMAPPKTVMCIQTRALNVTDLASCTYRADRCVGLVFDERTTVRRGIKTSDETMALVEAFARSCGAAVDVRDETPITL
ncbi:3-hydroxyacyl-CoA dehydrogenase [Terriglobus roseus DSM 18391]|uniref:3-hydroxyacyl-CoA dehydrogenase n=1 Tax=Terriglobus roseus (strain DSM 18391 / NRRL B-41598 / KBS 63) TaxID=926566 RepID=I3ZEV8_TERRK|nr:3-hydroxyacyl-CoA dehydrogenase NAD-binding domain-containing protein [Terriglobus roseus]AFL87776.1 3-hydroxyacyl-CoA dehydrogenase [Terriglobus roseus DSM 18391]